MRSDAPARIYTDANRKYRLPVRLETTNSFRRTVSQKKRGPWCPRRFSYRKQNGRSLCRERPKKSISAARHVSGMQELVRLMAAGLAEELLVCLLDKRIFMALAQRHIFVLRIKRLGAQSA